MSRKLRTQPAAVGHSAEPSDLLASLLARPHSASPPASPSASAPALQLAQFCGLDAQGMPLISIEGQAPQAAHSLAPLHSLRAGEQIAIAPLAAGALAPAYLILGLLHSPAASATADLPQAPAELLQEALEEQEEAALEVRMDGERLLLQARQEIELRCGDAAIVLSADGQIQLRGEYITSHASATQRIRGGSVNIN